MSPTGSRFDFRLLLRPATVMALDLHCHRETAIVPVGPACPLIVYFRLFQAPVMIGSLVFGPFLAMAKDFRLASAVGFFAARSLRAAAICLESFDSGSRSIDFAIGSAGFVVADSGLCRLSCFAIATVAPDLDFVRCRFAADFSSVVVAVEAVASVFVSGVASVARFSF